MKFGQSGVSGLLGFFDALSKGQQESQERKNKLLELGLGFAKENRELQRQNIADKRAADQFEAAQKLAKVQTEGAQFTQDQQKLVPYQQAVTGRAAAKATIAKIRGDIPALVEQLGKQRRPEAIAAIQAQIAEKQRQLDAVPQDWAKQLKAYGLTQAQIDELSSLDDSAVPVPNTTAPFTVPGQVPASQLSINAPSAQAPAVGGGTGAPLFQQERRFSVAPANKAQALAPVQAPAPASPLFSLMGQQVGQPSALAQPKQQPDVMSFLQGLGYKVPTPGSGPLTAEEQKELADAMEQMNLGGQINRSDLPEIVRDQKGFIDINAVPSNIDLGKATTRLLPQIRSSLKKLASSKNFTLDEVQKEFFGTDKTKWPLTSEGNDQTPDDLTAIKTAMSRYLSPKPEVVAKWADQMLDVDKENRKVAAEKTRMAFESVEAAKRDVNDIAVAKIQAETAANSQKGQETRAYAQQNADQINNADRNYQSAADVAVQGLATDPAGTLVQLGVVPRVTKLGKMVEVATAMAEELVAALPRERLKFTPTVSDYINGPSLFQSKLNIAASQARLSAVDAGIKKLDDMASTATGSTGGQNVGGAAQDIADARQELVNQKNAIIAQLKGLKSKPQQKKPAVRPAR